MGLLYCAAFLLELSTQKTTLIMFLSTRSADGFSNTIHVGQQHF